jgi:hypothetical protein
VISFDPGSSAVRLEHWDQSGGTRSPGPSAILQIIPLAL